MKILQDKLFISTRPPGKSDELKELLLQEGAIFFELPMIDVVAANLASNEKMLLLEPFHWIVFTSANGVHHFVEQLKAFSGSYSVGDKKIAVVGKRTAKCLEEYGLKADFVNSGRTAEALALDLRTIFSETKPRVLLPVGNLAATTIEEILKDVAQITRLEIYKTIMPLEFNNIALDAILANAYEMVIFTSPSGFHNFCQLVDGKFKLENLRAVCIGTTTSKALLDFGIVPMIIGDSMSSVGIASAIVDFYKSK